MTPDAYALSRYGNIPVNYSTGIPNITIPLITVTDHDITVDVSLSYYAGGIKVDQEAGSVGLGWSLNAGGVITREMRGKPDKMQNGKVFYDDLTDYWPVKMDKKTQETFYKEWVSKEYDQLNAPDVFTFNFCGYAGKFYLDSSGYGHLFTCEDLDVKIVEDKEYGYFKIIDQKGILYVFREKQNFKWDDVNQRYPNEWYLSSITSPSGGHITFKYSAAALVDYYYRKYDRLLVYGSNQSLGVQDVYATPIGSKMEHKYQLDLNGTECIKPLFLKSLKSGNVTINSIVSSSGDSIAFKGKFDRKDTKNDERISDIYHLNKDKKVIRQYRLDYGYFEPDDRHKLDINADGNYDKDFLNYRLKLKSITEISPNTGTPLPAYKFLYYSDSPNEHSLPYRLSPCQDHYGYYNASNNKTIFPGGNISDFDPWYQCLADKGTHGSFIVINGADREPNEEAMKSGSLKQIIYPTGGYNVFEYESHKSSSYYEGNKNIEKGGLRISGISDHDGKGHVNKRTYSYGESIWTASLSENYTTFSYFAIVGPEYNIRLAHGLNAQIHSQDSNNASWADGDDNALIINSYPVPDAFEQGFYYCNVEEATLKGKTLYEFSSGRSISEELGRLLDKYFNMSSNNLYFHHTAGSFNLNVSVFLSDGYFGCFPYLHILECPWTYGTLIKRKVFDNSNHIVLIDSYNYESKGIHAMPGYKRIKAGNCYVVGSESVSMFFGVDYVASGISRMTKETHTTYDASGKNPVTTTKEYTYGNADYLKCPTEVKETRSDGTVISTYTRYANDYTTQADNLDALKNKHIIAPVETRTMVNGKTVSGQQLKYNVNGQLVSVYSFTKDSPVFNKNNPYTFKRQSLYCVYNSKGLLKNEYNYDSGEYNTYVWGYSGQYPIAKISQLESAVSSNSNVKKVLDDVSSATGSEFKKNYWDTLFRQTCGTKAKAEFFDYVQSVGMSTHINSNGLTNVYEYDDFSRLKSRTLKSPKNMSRPQEKYSIKIGK